MSPPAEPGDRLLAWSKVREITGISRTTAWRLQRAGAFPAPVVVSPGRVAWRESELEAWKAARAPRRTPPPMPSLSPPRNAPAEPACSASARPQRPPRPAPAGRKGPRRRGATDGGAQLTFDF
ncbi:helix-turn-helix transcriptional regulator [Phenylobacterium terrae]|uniref:Helix-turn-helix transcriptional regulator n=1 Tax=Phenylobacterium terrae TaxID=2665495 RepID=A0ABW4N8Q1_9CAUL